ncbi:MAG: hypothetical protein WCO84_00575 [bacterium]
MNNKTHQMIQKNKGIAPLVLILVIALLAGGGSVAYLKSKKQPVSFDSVAKNILGTGNNDTIDNLKLENTDLNISLSPLPALNISALNIDVPNLDTPKIGNVVGNNDFNFFFDKSDIKLKSPDLSNFMPAITIPSTSETPTQTEGSAPTQIPQIDCSQFQTVPSCSYVPAGQAQDACKKCFPNK